MKGIFLSLSIKTLKQKIYLKSINFKLSIRFLKVIYRMTRHISITYLNVFSVSTYIFRIIIMMHLENTFVVFYYNCSKNKESSSKPNSFSKQIQNNSNLCPQIQPKMISMVFKMRIINVKYFCSSMFAF